MNPKLVRCGRSLIERLEERCLLALSASGGEFRVNAYTTSLQGAARVDMAMDADGDFVLVWDSVGQDGHVYGVYGQRFDASGATVGAEFRVNTYTTSQQMRPAVAMDADGDFVAVWASSTQDSGTFGVYGQRYNAAGVPQGGEFRVNTYTTDAQFARDVAMDAAGNFVVTWNSQQDSAGNYGVYAQRYRFDGVPLGSEFRVNNYTTGSQTNSSVSMSAAGNFVVVWNSTDQEGPGSSNGIYARRYDSSGAALGDEFLVNTFTTGSQASPSITMDFEGDFVIVWQSLNQDPGTSTGVYAQRYNAAGTPVGGEFRVNDYTTSTQSAPFAAMEANGGFVVAWQSANQEDSSSGAGIYAKRYDSSGTELAIPAGSLAGIGNEFLVNTTTTGAQQGPSVGMDARGNVVIAWRGNGPGDADGVFAQRYTESVDDASPIVAGVFVNGRRIEPYATAGGPVSQIVVSFSEAMLTSGGGVANPNSITNSANWLLTRGGVAQTPGITYGFNASHNRYEAVLSLPAPVSTDNFIIKLRDNTRDVAGNLLDGNLDGAEGGSFLLPFGVSELGPGSASEFRVNTHTAGDQQLASVAMNASGDFVVVWESEQDGDATGVYAQRYSAAGVAQGGEFKVNTFTTSIQGSPSVAMDASGAFVVVWRSLNQDGSSFGVYAQRYDAAGATLGGEFRVNSYTTNGQTHPKVAMDAAGGFTVAWQTSNQNSFSYDVYARRYNAAGVAVDTEFRVNTFTTADQVRPDVAMNDVGEAIIGWTEYTVEGISEDIYARRYSAAGVAQPEFRVNTYTTGVQRTARVAIHASGDFVVAWANLAGSGISAQRYNSASVAQGGEFTVNTYTTGQKFWADVAVEPEGDVVVVWQNNVQDSGTLGVYAQRYDMLGMPKGSEFKVNVFTNSSQQIPAVAANGSGDFVIVWESLGQDGSDWGVYAQRYGYRDLPVVATLGVDPDPVIIGTSLTLTAGGASADGGTVTAVSFYRETNGEPGLQIGVEGDTLLETDTTESGGEWTAVVPTTGLSLGPHTYWAQPIDDLGLLGKPASAASTIVSPPGPDITSAEFLYDTPPQKITFTFDGDASAGLGVEDILLEKIGGGAVPTLTMLPYGTDGTNVASFTMDSQLADGNYQATVLGVGGANVLSFFILGGDANHDRRVDVADLVIFANNYLGTGKTFSEADFNYDGVVNKTDLGTMAQNWHQALAQPAPALPAVPVSARPASRSPTRTPVRVIDLVQ